MEYGKATTELELLIETAIDNLAQLLDKQYNVKEFNGVLTQAIGDHIELIEEQAS